MAGELNGGGKPPPTAEQIARFFREWQELPRKRKTRRPMPSVVLCQPIADFLDPPMAPGGMIDTWAIGEQLSRPGTPHDLLKGQISEIIERAQVMRSTIQTFRNWMDRRGLESRRLPRDIERLGQACDALLKTRTPKRGRGRPRVDDAGFSDEIWQHCRTALFQGGWPENVSPDGAAGPVAFVTARILCELGEGQTKPATLRRKRGKINPGE